jgi:hypothetical protein
VLLAGIRALAVCPCPRCFIKKLSIYLMGTLGDMFRRNDLRVDTTGLRDLIGKARHQIFVLGKAIASASVDTLLKAYSWVPVQARLPFMTLLYAVLIL